MLKHQVNKVPEKSELELRVEALEKAHNEMKANNETLTKKLNTLEKKVIIK